MSRLSNPLSATGEDIPLDEHFALHLGVFEPFEGGQCLDGFFGLLFGQADLIQALQIQPELSRCAEKMRLAQGCVTGDCPPATADF